MPARMTEAASDIDMADATAGEDPSNTSNSAPSAKAPRQRRVHRAPISAEEAEEREQERRRRWRECGFLVDEFDRDTKESRQWHQYHKGQQLLWENEKKRIATVKPKLEAELVKAKQDLANIEAAEKCFDEKYGKRATEGRANEEALRRYQKYLRMESDEEPKLEG